MNDSQHFLTVCETFDSEGDRDDLDTKFECVGNDQAECQLVCSGLCESWHIEYILAGDSVKAIHGGEEGCGLDMIPSSHGCNAVEWFDSWDTIDGTDINLRHGRHKIEIEWDGDGYVWQYLTRERWYHRVIVSTRKRLWRFTK